MFRLSKPQSKYELHSFKFQALVMKQDGGASLGFTCHDAKGVQVDICSMDLDEDETVEFIKCGVCDKACEALKKHTGFDGEIE